MRVGVHGGTLTVEPEFKSSGDGCTDASLTIGEVAAPGRRRDLGGPLLRAARPARRRRPPSRASAATTPATLRRLVFIGMLQDAGLSLDDIAGILDAADRRGMEGDRRATPRRRSTRRSTAWSRPAPTSPGALLCRYDHPATDCQIMGAEIDRRLSEDRAGGDPGRRACGNVRAGCCQRWPRPPICAPTSTDPLSGGGEAFGAAEVDDAKAANTSCHPIDYFSPDTISRVMDPPPPSIAGTGGGSEDQWRT